jgi:hypothetical protein
MASPVLAATTSGAVAATDERAPATVTDVTGFPGTAGVEISWALSASDFVRQSPTGSDFTSGGSFSNVNDVAAYNIYRDGEFAGTVRAGEMMFVDLEAIGTSIVYTVTAVDAAGNESADSEGAIVSLGPPPAAAITVPDGDYGVVDADAVVSQTIDIANNATDAGAVLTATITVDGDGFSASEATITVAPGESASVDVSFDAAAVLNINAIYAGSVTVRTNDPDNRETNYATVAEIVDGVGLPALDVTPASVSFAPTVVGDTRARNIVISNVGGPTLEGAITISGDDAFTISADGSYSLGAAGTQSVAVTFAPGAVATYTATITITSNDANATSTDIEVSGRGTDAPEGPGVIATPVTKVAMAFNRAFPTDQVDIDALRDQIIAALAEALGIPISRFIDVVLTEGSVIVNFTITQTTTTEGEPTAAEAVATLEAVIADTATTNVITDIAPVTSVVDNSETVVLQPEDADGNPVLGWFTLASSGQVGINDFFAFAAKFGTVTADADFDSKFDLIGRTAGSDPDGLVGIDDFFTFAANFGKIVANADEILAALQ